MILMSGEIPFVVPTNELSIAVASELLIPDPINIVKGMEIIENATNTSTTRDDTESN